MRHAGPGIVFGFQIQRTFDAPSSANTAWTCRQAVTYWSAVLPFTPTAHG